MKRILVLVVLFSYIYPVFPKFSPIPVDRILQLLGIITLFLNPQDIRHLLRSKTFYLFYAITSIILLLAFLAQIQIKNGSYDTYFLKKIIDVYLSLFSAYFVVWTIRQIHAQINLQIILYYFVLAAALQTIISVIFFTNDNVFELYLSFIKEETNTGLLDRSSLISKRFIGFGSQFFSGVIKYGAAFFAAILLPYYKGKSTFKSNILYWSSVFLIIIGGLFTGRTFFVAIGLGVLMYLIINTKSYVTFIKHNLKLITYTLVGVSLLLLLGSLILEKEKLETSLDFIFEMFINFSEEGTLTTSSSDVTMSMFIIPENINTWLFGDGRMMEENGGYYMRTDVGYIRLLFYFGLPSTLFLIFSLIRYTDITIKITNDKVSRTFLLFFLIWILVLNLKGLAIEENYFVLFLVSGVLANKEIHKNTNARLIH